MLSDLRERIPEHGRPSEEPPWHLLQRICFRLAFCYILVYYASSVLGVLPGAGGVVSHFSQLWDRAVLVLCGVPSQTPPEPTGSGDTALAYIENAIDVGIAVVAGALWTFLDRRRPGYIGLHGWLRVVARYALAFALLSYAFAKIIPTQFSPLQARQLAESYGESSPMALLWNFMGFSPAYTIFGGCAELLPAILLIFRRTALLGALIASGVMLNIVMLNLCYDVPVKLYSLNLLLLSIFLVLPEAQRLLRIFILNHPASPSDLRHPFLQKRWLQRTALALKIGVLVIFLVQSIHSAVSYHHRLSARTPPPAYPLTSRGFHWIQEYPYNR